MSWGKKICKIKKSLPIRGVWIEICRQKNLRKPLRGSLPIRGVWIEIENNEGFSDRIL